MVRWFVKRRRGPIGIDVGSTTVKLLQLSADRTEVLEAACWELPAGPEGQPDRSPASVAEAIRRAREGRGFRGREAVFCLGAGDLFMQNIRVPQAAGDELTKIVCAEAAGRLPFDSGEAEIRYLEADNVRQGDSLRREVILLACRRPVVERTVAVAEDAGLVPVALDIEPSALLRCYARQYRRDADQERRAMFVNVGGSNTTVVIARGCRAMFAKCLDVGGRHFDEAVARHLKMKPADAAALRRHHGDRREAGLPAHLRAEHSQHRSRRHDLLHQVAGEAQRGKQLLLPLSGHGVVELGSGGEGELRPFLAAQEVADEVGHEEQVPRPREGGGAVAHHRLKLEERVEGQELNAGQFVHALPRHPAEELLPGAGVAEVAVGARLLQQSSLLVEEPEVHSPGVHGNARRRLFLGRALAQRYLALLEQPRGVPVKPLAQRDHFVLEAADLAEAQSPLRQRAEHRPAALRAEIEGKKGSRCRSHSLPPRGARGHSMPSASASASTGVNTRSNTS